MTNNLADNNYSDSFSNFNKLLLGQYASPYNGKLHKLPYFPTMFYSCIALHRSSDPPHYDSPPGPP